MALQPRRGLYFEEFVVGDRAVSATRTITETDIVAFAGLSGDFNEIHTSAEYSKQSPAGQRVAHGLLGLSIASGLAVQMGFMLNTVEFFRNIEWEFTAPIYIGDTVQLDVEIAEVKAFTRLNNGKVTFKLALKKQDGSVTQRGTWGILVKMQPKAA
jgi:acyl dehydratase